MNGGFPGPQLFTQIFYPADSRFDQCGGSVPRGASGVDPTLVTAPSSVVIVIAAAARPELIV